ncbi:MAG: hypothetical protein WEG36_08970 [Gemmatimonadota bacterium]
MAERDAFLIRVDPKTLDAVRRWADDELRSVNGQIEFILRRALKEAGRLKAGSKGETTIEARKGGEVK